MHFFFDRVVLTRADPYRSLSVDDLALRVRAVEPNLELEKISDPGEAARAARAATGSGELLVAAGSVYLAAAAREQWRGN